MARSDRLPGGAEHGAVGDAHTSGVARFEPQGLDAPLDPRPRAVNDDESDAEAAQQREIVNDAVKLRIVRRRAVNLDDEGSSPVGVDVGGGPAEPFDERRRFRGRVAMVHLGRLLSHRGQTLRSRNSRSQELMTWRNARSSHSFTAFQARTNRSPRASMRGRVPRSVRSDSARLSGSS